MSRFRKSNGAYETTYKDFALRAAKDFEYGDEVLKEIEATDNNDKIADIMMRARHAKFD